MKAHRTGEDGVRLLLGDPSFCREKGVCLYKFSFISLFLAVQL